MQSIIDSIWNFGRDHIATALTSLLSTFFGASVGAWVALVFERWKVARAASSARCGELFEAHLVLMCHANSLYDEIRKFAPYRNFPDRERRIPYIEHTFDESRIDVRKLSFLLKGPVPDLALTIHTVDMCYRSACGVLKLRNKLIDDLRASMDVIDHDPATGKTGGIADLTVLTLLRQATDSAFNCLDSAFSDTMHTLDLIVTTAKVMFPEAGFKSLEFPPLPNEKELR